MLQLKGVQLTITATLITLLTCTWGTCRRRSVLRQPSESVELCMSSHHYHTWDTFSQPIYEQDSMNPYYNIRQ